MKTHPTDISNQDAMETVLSAIQAFASNTEVRLTKIESRLTGTELKLEGLPRIHARLTKIESTMVTKDYLDDKIADLKGELIILARKANTKLSVFVEELVASKTLKRSIADKILALEPFPNK